MRNIIISLLAVGVVGPAAAQPVTQPAQCAVTISRAPDDVRQAIEAWVNAEPRCTTTLDVRVVPTDGGLYLFARDANGRVRERIVPDAQSAGVLVASWVADDLIDTHVPAEAPVLDAGAAAPVTAAGGPPGATAPVLAPVPSATGVRATTEARAPSRWLTIGGTMQAGYPDAVALRADVDLWRRGKWSLGAGLIAARFELATWYASVGGRIEVTDIGALAQLSRTTQFGRRLSVRLGIGAGIMATHGTGTLGDMTLDQSGATAIGEASILGSYHIGRWAIGFGPILSTYSQNFDLEDNGYTVRLNRNVNELLIFGGLRRRL